MVIMSHLLKPYRIPSLLHVQSNLGDGRCIGHDGSVFRTWQNPSWQMGWISKADFPRTWIMSLINWGSAIRMNLCPYGALLHQQILWHRVWVTSRFLIYFRKICFQDPSIATQDIPFGVLLFINNMIYVWGFILSLYSLHYSFWVFILSIHKIGKC